MRNISIKGVVIGTVVGVVLDTVAALALTLLFHHDAEPSNVVGSNAYGVNPPLLWGLVIGLLTTVVSGYVGAKIAKRLPYMNAAAIGAVGVLLGAFLADSSLPLWFNAIGFTLTLPCALAGGHLAKRRLQPGA